MKKVKRGAVIGRFQPPHIGHFSMLKEAASRCEQLLILIGSANACRSIKNPWTYSERVHTIRSKLWADGITNITFLPLNDYTYNDALWITQVKATIDAYTDSDVTLFGHMKEGNDYLQWFGNSYKFQDIQSIHTVNGTMIQQKMFENRDSNIPETVQQDYEFYQREKSLFENYPFKETLNFNCADSVVLCNGNVLMIQRKNSPGKGAWALPGGFKNRNETFLDCAIRELKEETGLKVPEKVLRGSIVQSKMYDSPTRSFGIPRNTYAFLFDIAPNNDGTLPKVSGSDDAKLATWVSLADFQSQMFMMYDDHRDIISSLTGVYQQFAYFSML